jgi:hypothetical protein
MPEIPVAFSVGRFIIALFASAAELGAGQAQGSKSIHDTSGKTRLAAG